MVWAQELWIHPSFLSVPWSSLDTIEAFQCHIHMWQLCWSACFARAHSLSGPRQNVRNENNWCGGSFPIWQMGKGIGTVGHCRKKANSFLKKNKKTDSSGIINTVLLLDYIKKKTTQKNLTFKQDSNKNWNTLIHFSSFLN